MKSFDVTEKKERERGEGGREGTDYTQSGMWLRLKNLVK